MSSSSSIPSSKQGCFRASTADILSLGFFFSILASRLRALGSRLLYSYPSKVMLLARFWANTQLQVFPGKALTPRSRMWKISPRLNISQMGSYFVLMSLMLMTSGATQPGVPQRTKRQSGSSENQASPKSATTQSQLPSCLKMRFSGLRSRCMIFLECISLSPRRMEETISLVSLGLNLYLALTLSYRSPPSRSSTTMQRELSDSKTSKSFMQFLWLRLLMISISLMRHSLPLSSLQAASFEKAFTAQFFPLSSFSARYTEAKFPFPIFFLGLNCSWNPRWFIFPDRISRHLLRSPSECRKQLAFSSIFSSNTVAGLTMNENLSQKSKWMYTFPLVFDYTMHLSYSAMCTSPY